MENAHASKEGGGSSEEEGEALESPVFLLPNQYRQRAFSGRVVLTPEQALKWWMGKREDPRDPKFDPPGH